MKRVYVLLIACLLAVSLAACASKGASSVYTVTKNNIEFTVDQGNGTISDGKDTYRYTVSGQSSGYHIEITYPNGATYFWTVQRGGATSAGFGGWSDDYDEDRYVSGRILIDILEEKAPSRSSSKNVPVIILFLALGIFNTASPYTAWYLEYGWRYKDAEPSELALGANRFGGILAILIAVIMIFV